MFIEHPLQDTIGVILGGGEGSRLFPLTRERSKPAVPFGGKFRFIDIAISNSINSGLKNLFVLTQYNSASLNNHVGRTYRFDHFSEGFVAVLAAEQRHDRDPTWFEGTADAVRQNLKYLDNPSFENVLIIPGDHLCRINFNDILRVHEMRKADVTLCAAVVGREEAKRFRVLRLADDGRVTDLVRKPADPSVLARFRLRPSIRKVHRVDESLAPDEGYLAFMGIYLMRREVLVNLLRSVDDRDLGRDTLPRVLWGRRTFCHVFNGYWRDIGTVKSFYEESMALTLDDPPFRFWDPVAPIYSHARHLPGPISYDSKLDGVLLSDGSEIREATVERSVIGPRTVIGKGAFFSYSVIFGADTFEGDNRRAAAYTGNGLPPLGIGPGCVVRKAIIDKNARIGEGSRLENASNIQEADGENYYIRNGIILIPKFAVIPPGTVI